MNFKIWFESFESPLPIEWIEKTPTDWEGEFYVPTLQVVSSKPKKTKYAFVPQGKKYVIRMMKLPMGGTWEIKFELELDGKKTQEITGTGDSMRVFSTVLSGIREFISEVNPKSIAFSAREPSRQSLYARLLRLLPSTEWKVEEMGEIFFAKRKSAKKVYSGYSDDDFSDFYRDDL